MIDKNIDVQTYTIPKMLGIKELAKEFHIPATAIRHWISSGQLPVVMCGKKFLVNCTVFSKFLEGSTVTEPQTIEPVAIDGKEQLYTAAESKKKAVGRIEPIY